MTRNIIIKLLILNAYIGKMLLNATPVTFKQLKAYLLNFIVTAKWNINTIIYLKILCNIENLVKGIRTLSILYDLSNI